MRIAVKPALKRSTPASPANTASRGATTILTDAAAQLFNLSGDFGSQATPSNVAADLDSDGDLDILSIDV